MARRRSILGTAVRASIIANAAGSVAERSARAKAQAHAATTAPPLGQPHAAPIPHSPIAAPAPASAPANEAGADPIAQIERLAALHATGALTDQEFAAAKARVLS